MATKATKTAKTYLVNGRVTESISWKGQLYFAGESLPANYPPADLQRHLDDGEVHEKGTPRPARKVVRGRLARKKDDDLVDEERAVRRFAPSDESDDDDFDDEEDLDEEDLVDDLEDEGEMRIPVEKFHDANEEEATKPEKKKRGRPRKVVVETE